MPETLVIHMSFILRALLQFAFPLHTFGRGNLMQRVHAEVRGTAGWGNSRGCLCDCRLVEAVPGRLLTVALIWPGEAAAAAGAAAGCSGPTQPCQLWVDLGTVPASHLDCCIRCVHRHK